MYRQWWVWIDEENDSNSIIRLDLQVISAKQQTQTPAIETECSKLI